MKEYPQESCTNCNKESSSWCVCKRCRKNSKKLLELKKIYPVIVSIINGWQWMAQIHGDTQTKYEKKMLTKYVKILIDLGVLEKKNLK